VTIPVVEMKINIESGAALVEVSSSVYVKIGQETRLLVQVEPSATVTRLFNNMS
jgi:hypothetical protein